MITPKDLYDWADKGWWVKIKDDQGVYSGCNDVHWRLWCIEPIVYEES